MINKLKKHYISLLLLALGVLLAFFPLYFNGGFIGDLGDPIGQTIPNKYLLVEYLKNGILPLWNPFSFLGFPFLADIQVGTFYIPDILFFSIFSPLTAHNFSVLAHLIFSAVGIYFFCFNYLKSKCSSIAIALSVVLSGSFLSRIVYLNFLETIAFIPWVLLALDQKRSSFYTLLFLFSMMIFAGHPVAMFYSSIIIGTYLIINRVEKFKKVLAAGATSLLVCSIQIVPFLYLKLNSVRDSLSYQDFVGGSLHFSNFKSFTWPLFQNINFDSFIYFGSFAFLYIVISIFFIKNFSKKIKKIYLTGLGLFILGIILSLGSNFEILSKLLFEVPVFNLIRVPARYILISHFGVILMLIGFFTYLNKNKKLISFLLTLPLILNAVVTPYLTLERYDILAANQEYNFEIKKTIEENSKVKTSIKSVPNYFLSSSFFLFPNRHRLSYLHNTIGYNPLILETFYKFLPVSPVGSFENPNYFMDYYEKFNLVGLKYYIFPSNEFLKSKNLGEKTFINKFLTRNNWKILGDENKNFKIWENPNAKPFAYFENSKNKIKDINFKPGRIILNVETSSADTLVINQTFVEGWKMKTDLDNKISKSEIFSDIAQSYKVKTGTKVIEVYYLPKELVIGFMLSLLGLISGVIFKKHL
ncbi:hypothetical protein CL656_00665 [bacterium]|nr:hypothetical protein [bacterium]|tara:strand:+ start:329 stop:2257 length:1929 start_codon:yes stop_codon:yes gene_type:complete